MAKFITRKGMVHHIDRLIEEAEKEIILISPYIKADDETKKLIAKTKRDISFDVIYGKTEMMQKEKEFFNRLRIKLSYRENLHAKCYLNEKEAIVTSMNLYEYSQLYNEEMGILVSRDDDPELYEAIHSQAMEWKTDSGGVNATASGGKAEKAASVNPAVSGKVSAGAEGTPKEPQQSVKPKRPRNPTPTLAAPENGYCIRCKADLPPIPLKPYCFNCFTSWSEHENGAFKENHCHTCGNKRKTSRRKPSCLACYKKYSAVLKFPTG